MRFKSQFLTNIITVIVLLGIQNLYVQAKFEDTPASLKINNSTVEQNGTTVVIENDKAEVTVDNVNKWQNCVAKGSQLIDMAHDGSYITFDVKSIQGGSFTFASDIATSLNDIGCILGYTNANGNFVEADTLDIANTGSWTTTRNYKWLFTLETGKIYNFKMQCIAGAGYALNTFNIKINQFVPNISIQEVAVNGFAVIPQNDAYSAEAYCNEDISINVTSQSSTAKVSYTATINNNSINVTNGIINNTDISEGDVIHVVAKISDGNIAYENYEIIINATENRKHQIQGTIEDDGTWTNVGSSSNTKLWTDYIYTLRPAETSTRFYNTSWTGADGVKRFGIIANDASVSIEIPSYFKIHSVSFIGYDGGTIELSCDSAAITSPETPNFNANATGSQPDEIKFVVNDHTPGTPLTFSVNGSDCKMYLVLSYTEVDDITAPLLVEQNIADNALIQNTSSFFLLRFNEAIRLSEAASATLDGENVKLKIENNVFVRHNFFGLDYDSQHTFIITANSIEDLSGNAFANDITINFSTGSKPEVTKKVYDFVVGVDGNINEAISAVNKASGNNRYYIFVPNGTYELSGNDADHMTNLTRSNVSIIGQSKDDAIVCNTPESYGISSTATIHLKYVENIYLEDLTIKNNSGAPNGGQQVALFDRGSKNIMKNVKLYSYQDTYVTGDRAYHEDCEFYGSVDYICGGGNLFFDNCFFYNLLSSGNKVCAPATSPDQKWGYVFMNCTIDGGSYVLGRPWKDEPKAYFLYTKLNKQPSGTGWEGMGGVKTFFYEYMSMDYDGNLYDLSKRGNSPTSTNSYDPILTDEEAAEFTMYNVVGGTDGYLPTDYTIQTKAPAVTLSDNKLSWEDDPDAMCYVIFRNNEFVICTTENNLELPAEGVYTIQSANAMGGLGEITTINYGTTGLNLLKENKKNLNNGIYDIYGRKLNSIPVKGVFIMNGRKYYKY